MPKTKKQTLQTEDEVFKINYMQALNDKIKLRGQLGALKNQLEDLHARNERLGYEILDKRDALQGSSEKRSDTGTPTMPKAAKVPSPPKAVVPKVISSPVPETDLGLIRSVPSPSNSPPKVSPKKNIETPPAVSPKVVVAMVAKGGTPVSSVGTSPMPTPKMEVPPIPPPRPKPPKQEAPPVTPEPPPDKPEKVAAFTETMSTPTPLPPLPLPPPPKARFKQKGTMPLEKNVKIIEEIEENVEDEEILEPEIVYQEEVVISKREKPKISTNIPELRDELENLKRMFANITFYTIMIVLALFSVIFAKELHNYISRIPKVVMPPVPVVPLKADKTICICEEPQPIVAICEKPLPPIQATAICDKPTPPVQNLCICDTSSTLPVDLGSGHAISSSSTVTPPPMQVQCTSIPRPAISSNRHGEIADVTVQGVQDSRPKIQVQYKMQMEDIISMYDCDDCNKQIPKTCSEIVKSAS